MKRILCVLCVLYVLWSGRISTAEATVASTPPHSAAVALVPPHAAQRTNPLAIVGIFALTLCVGLAQMALVAGAIAYQFPRTLSCDPSDEWDDADYFRSLPNALAVLAEQNFATAWPRRCNPWCMNRFQRRLEHALEPLLKRNVQRFVRQHLSAWKWTISHRNTVTQLLRMRGREQASRLLAIADPEERIALLAALNAPPQDRRCSRREVTERRLKRLERLHAILREHGYSPEPKIDHINEPSVPSLRLDPSPR